MWTNFAHVASVFSRTHLTFNDRHLSQDMVLDWLFLGAILEFHLVDYHESVSMFYICCCGQGNHMKLSSWHDFNEVERPIPSRAFNLLLYRAVACAKISA